MKKLLVITYLFTSLSLFASQITGIAPSYAGKTLVLSGEEGEVEYEKEFLEKYNTVVKYFDNQDEFTALQLQKIVNEIRPDRIVIELNGMWDVSKVEDMDEMFAYSKFDKDISKWKVSTGRNSDIFRKSPLEKNPPKWY